MALRDIWGCRNVRLERSPLRDLTRPASSRQHPHDHAQTNYLKLHFHKLAWSCETRLILATCIHPLDLSSTHHAQSESLPPAAWQLALVIPRKLVIPCEKLYAKTRLAQTITTSAWKNKSVWIRYTHKRCQCQSSLAQKAERARRRLNEKAHKLKRDALC